LYLRGVFVNLQTFDVASITCDGIMRSGIRVRRLVGKDALKHFQSAAALTELLTVGKKIFFWRLRFS